MPEEVDIVLFEIAGVRYGADLAQVRRVDTHDPTESVGFPFGQPSVGHRTLVFSPATGEERRLVIDAVLGVKRVPVAELRRMPSAVAAPPMSIGAWVSEGELVLLVDLHALNKVENTLHEQGNMNGH